MLLFVAATMLSLTSCGKDDTTTFPLRLRQ